MRFLDRADGPDVSVLPPSLTPLPLPAERAHNCGVPGGSLFAFAAPFLLRAAPTLFPSSPA
jgi:hypothetical protein